jgi:DNA-directed RNA polymerase
MRLSQKKRVAPDYFRDTLLEVHALLRCLTIHEDESLLSQISIDYEFNIPMICKPKKWVRNHEEDVSSVDEYVSYTLQGGYLSENKFLSLLRYNFLTSKSIEDFRITKVLDNILNNISKLQLVAFQVDPFFFEFVQNEQKTLIRLELLHDPDLCDINVEKYVAQKRKEAGPLASFNYSIESKKIRELHNFALWERTRLLLCKILKGIPIYFPAFIDFRGRVYRAGLISWHEKELIRALTCFHWDKTLNLKESAYCKKILHRAIGFLTTRCKTNNEAVGAANRFLDKNNLFDIDKLLNQADNPLLATRAALWYNRGENLHLCPISVDASSSAYQFLAYLTCDVELAKKVNLIASPKKSQIQDLYLDVAQSLSKYIKQENISFPDGISVKVLTSRKLMKATYMPLFYGKTLMSITEDLEKNFFAERISRKEAFKIGRILNDFGNIKFANCKKFMLLCQKLAKVCALLDKALYLNNSELHIVQDYRVYEKVKVSFYSPGKVLKDITKDITKLKRRITLSERTEKRDPRRSSQAITANLIHSLDALVAQKVIGMFTNDHPGAPIYTVHDCFVTSPLYAEKISTYYNKAFLELGCPIRLINSYIHINLLDLDESFDLDVVWTKNTIQARLTELHQLHKQQKRCKAANIIKAISEFTQAYEDFMSLLSKEKVTQFLNSLKNNPGHFCVHL